MSKTNDKDEILYTYGRYEVRICDNVEDGSLNTTGYGVFNKQTGIREYSDITLVNAVNMARTFELHLREALAKIETPSDSLFDKGEPEVLKALN